MKLIYLIISKRLFLVLALLLQYEGGVASIFVNSYKSCTTDSDCATSTFKTCQAFRFYRVKEEKYCSPPFLALRMKATMVETVQEEMVSSILSNVMPHVEGLQKRTIDDIKEYQKFEAKETKESHQNMLKHFEQAYLDLAVLSIGERVMLRRYMQRKFATSFHKDLMLIKALMNTPVSLKKYDKQIQAVEEKISFEENKMPGTSMAAVCNQLKIINYMEMEKYRIKLKRALYDINNSNLSKKHADIVRNNAKHGAKVNMQAASMMYRAMCLGEKEAIGIPIIHLEPEPETDEIKFSIYTAGNNIYAGGDKRNFTVSNIEVLPPMVHESWPDVDSFELEEDGGNIKEQIKAFSKIPEYDETNTIIKEDKNDNKPENRLPDYEEKPKNNTKGKFWEITEGLKWVAKFAVNVQKDAIISYLFEHKLKSPITYDQAKHIIKLKDANNEHAVACWSAKLYAIAVPTVTIVTGVNEKTVGGKSMATMFDEFINFPRHGQPQTSCN